MRQTAASTIAGRMLTATFLVCVGILAVAYVNAQGLDVVYVPTPRETVDRMLQVTEVGSADYVIDLGSGDGRIAIAAGRLGARALGVELDPARLRDAELNAQRAGVTDRVTFRQQNLFETDLSPATVLTMYLLPSINVKLRPKILSLRPGTRVVSHDFTMGDWKSDLTETNNWRIHMWIVPARVMGKWQVRFGNRNFDLTIDQTYQEFRGMANVDGRTLALRNTRLRAATIEFTVDLDGQAATLRGSRQWRPHARAQQRRRRVERHPLVTPENENGRIAPAIPRNASILPRARRLVIPAFRPVPAPCRRRPILRAAAAPSVCSPAALAAALLTSSPWPAERTGWFAASPA